MRTTRFLFLCLLFAGDTFVVRCTHMLSPCLLTGPQIGIYLDKRDQMPLQRPADLLNCAQDCCHLSNLVYQPDLYDVLTVNKMQRLLTKTCVLLV
jgi:hypothetical protein